MRLNFWVADKGFEKLLGPAVVAGAALNGDEVIMRPMAEYKNAKEPSIVLGVVRREIIWDHQVSGAPLVYIDKGWPRQREQLHGDRAVPVFWRLCWQAQQPTAYLMQLHARADRWKRLNQAIPAGRHATTQGHVLVIGSSEKFHHTARIEHPTKWAETLVSRIKSRTSRLVIYRPKQTWKYAAPVALSRFDHGHKTLIQESLRNCWVSVTHGSYGCVDSILAGVPCIVLGDAVARPIGGAYVHEVENPPWPARPKIEQWAANLAYTNFRREELADGSAWKIFKEQMRHAV